ncbi:MAG TPA: hypothetical protein VK462_04350 [Nitrososphaeraceae archaeon]|nr:hypothetical protein [Nitrososphaeraceae archaeon]
MRHTSLIDLNIDMVTADVVEAASLYVYDVGVLESHEGHDKKEQRTAFRIGASYRKRLKRLPTSTQRYSIYLFLTLVD